MNFHLQTILQSIFPSMTSYEIRTEIIQANAMGFGVHVLREPNEPRDLFVKIVDVAKYDHKTWTDVRRTLLYARTEIRFYDEFLPFLRKRMHDGWTIAPHCHLAMYDMNGLIDDGEMVVALPESECGVEENGSDPPGWLDKKMRLERGGVIVLDSLDVQTGFEISSSQLSTGVTGECQTCNYLQESPITHTQASACLDAVARLHAVTFKDKTLLKRVGERLAIYGGSYNLSIRNPKELANIEQSWNAFVSAFSDAPSLPKGFFERESIRTLGTRVKKMASYVSKELSPRYDDDYATLVHGDFKAMNVFLPNPASSDCSEMDKCQTTLIDFASSGVGLGMSDVAMHIAHAVHPRDLQNGGEEALIDIYLTSLERSLPARKKGAYPRKQAMRHYKLASIDYLRFIMGRFWGSASLDLFEKRKKNKNTTLGNLYFTIIFIILGFSFCHLLINTFV